jgi:hypothetical protein
MLGAGARHQMTRTWVDSEVSRVEVVNEFPVGSAEAQVGI